MYLPKNVSMMIGQKDAEVLSLSDVGAFRTHRKVSWADVMKTWLLHEPEMSSENFTGYLRTRIAERSGEIIAAGNKIVMDVPHDPIRIRMNRSLMDRVFEDIVDRAVRKSECRVTLYINLWKKGERVFLLIGDNRKEAANPWKLISMREIIEYHGGSLLILGLGKRKKKEDGAPAGSLRDPESGMYYALRLPTAE